MKKRERRQICVEVSHQSSLFCPPVTSKLQKMQERNDNFSPLSSSSCETSVGRILGTNREISPPPLSLFWASVVSAWLGWLVTPIKKWERRRGRGCFALFVLQLLHAIGMHKKVSGAAPGAACTIGGHVATFALPHLQYLSSGIRPQGPLTLGVKYKVVTWPWRSVGGSSDIFFFFKGKEKACLCCVDSW